MGEKSKKSGEIGEEISKKLLELIGWKTFLQNVTIACNNKSHVNESGNPRKTHGGDIIFIYHNPFHDDRTDIVHVSVKNSLSAPPSPATLKRKFKEHYTELQETIACAKHSKEIQDICDAYGTRNKKTHSGLLIWLHNEDTNLECDIKPQLSNVRLEEDCIFPVYLIDNSRAAFLIKIIDDISIRFSKKTSDFFYPQIGTNIYDKEKRSGNSLPLELIASDIVPCLIRSEDSTSVELVIYANQAFSQNSYKRILSYALKFSAGIIKRIYIGMPDYNPTKDEQAAQLARMHFSEREEIITIFSFKKSILSLLETGE